MLFMETALSRLGSRFCLNPRPQKRTLAHGAAGRFLDEECELAVGLRGATGRRILPLCRDGVVFEFAHMGITMTTFSFRCRSRELGLGFRANFTAPFYPGDFKTSTAPVFFIDLEAWKLPPEHHHEQNAPEEFEIFLEFKRPNTQIAAGDRRLNISYVTKIDRHYLEFPGSRHSPDKEWIVNEIACAERVSALDVNVRAEENALVWTARLSEPETLKARAVWSAYVSDPVLERGGKGYRFFAATLFSSHERLEKWAVDKREEILDKSRFFDSVFENSSLGKAKRDLVAFSFQSYLMNAWLLVGDDGEKWFSVWEGCCRFHSTIDVEYNCSMFYLALWPELLKMTIREWRDHEKTGPADERNRPTGFMSHDMGSCQNVDGQDYPHEMEVEENTNFLLMLHALWKWTGDGSLIEENRELALRLIRYVIAADTTGNGFPDRGVSNTIDDASPAVQNAREQSYLAVKALCAAESAAAIFRELGMTDDAWEAEEFARKTLATLETRAWLGDHYAVCIDKETRGVTHAWSGEKIGGDELKGWDAYSLYTANGALLPLMSGLDCGLDRDRIRRDLESALERSVSEYGCTHSSVDHGNAWISQNLWRDYVAAYLGLDFLDEAERYWAFQIHQNSRSPGRCFIDTYGWNRLEYYPRGVCSMGLYLASLGLKIDRAAKTVSLAPPRAPFKGPILPLVDWEKRCVPMVDSSLIDGQIITRVMNVDHLCGWTIEIE